MALCLLGFLAAVAQPPHPMPVRAQAVPVAAASGLFRTWVSVPSQAARARLAALDVVVASGVYAVLAVGLGLLSSGDLRTLRSGIPGLAPRSVPASISADGLEIACHRGPRAFDDVQTAPPCSPTNAFRSAAEFMYVTGTTRSMSVITKICSISLSDSAWSKNADSLRRPLFTYGPAGLKLNRPDAGWPEGHAKCSEQSRR